MVANKECMEHDKVKEQNQRRRKTEKDEKSNSQGYNLANDSCKFVNN